VPHAEGSNHHNGRSSPRITGIEPYMQKVEQTLTHETCPERRKMLEHLKRYTLVKHFKPDCPKQSGAVKQLIDDVTDGKFTTFKAFSKDGLLPYVLKHHPAPVRKQPTAEELYQRRVAAEELAKSKLATRRSSPSLSIAAVRGKRGIHTANKRT